MSAPGTLAEAIAERQRLTQEVSDIQTQLANRNATDESGQRIPAQDYWAWRHRAMFAMRSKERRASELKMFITTERQRTAAVMAGGMISGTVSAESLLAALVGLVKRLSAEGVELDAQEQALVDAARDLLTHGTLTGGAR